MSVKRWKWLRGIKEIASPLPCCPVNHNCSWQKTQTENSVKVTSVMMVSNIFRPLYITLTFSHNTQVTTIVTMSDNNTFSFNTVILELYLTPRRKPKFLSNSVKRNTFSKFEFTALKVVSATFLLVCFWGKKFFISIQKLFLFWRRSNLGILHFQISWCHQMPKFKTRNIFHWITCKGNAAC